MVTNYLKKATAGIALLAMSSFANADGHSEISYSANLGFMSDYMYRGIHQSSSSAMGGFDIEYGSFYLGTWFADLQEGGWEGSGDDSHRGFEYDVYAGFGFGILLLAPIANMLIESYGWRLTYQYFGLSFLCLLPFVAALPWKTIEKGAPNNPRRTVSGKAKGGFSLNEALKMRAYWAMFLIYFLTAFAIFGVSVQSVAYLV